MALQASTSFISRARDLRKQQNSIEGSGETTEQDFLITQANEKSFFDMINEISDNEDYQFAEAESVSSRDSMKTQDMSLVYVNNFPRYTSEGYLIPADPVDQGVLDPAAPNYEGLTSKITKILSLLVNKVESVDAALFNAGYNIEDVASMKNKQLTAKIALGLLYSYSMSKEEMKTRHRKISNDLNLKEIEVDTALYNTALYNARIRHFDSIKTPKIVRDFITKLEAAQNQANDVPPEIQVASDISDSGSEAAVALESFVVCILRSSPEYFMVMPPILSRDETFNATKPFKQIIRNNPSIAKSAQDHIRVETATIDQPISNKSQLLRAKDYFASRPWKASKGTLNSVLSMLMNVMKGTPQFKQTGRDETFFNGLSVSVSDHQFASVFGMDKQSLIDCMNAQRPNSVDFITQESLVDLQTQYNQSMQWIDLAVNSLNSKVDRNINLLIELLNKKSSTFYFEFDFIGKSMMIRNATNSIKFGHAPILCGLIADNNVVLVNPKSNGVAEQKFKLTAVMNLSLEHPTLNDEMKMGTMPLSETTRMLMLETFDIYFCDNDMFFKQAKKMKLNEETEKNVIATRNKLWSAVMSASGLSKDTKGKIDLSLPRMTNFVVDPTLAKTYIDQSVKQGIDPLYNSRWMEAVAAIAKSTALGIVLDGEASITQVLNTGSYDRAAGNYSVMKINTLVNIGSYIIGSPFSSDLVYKQKIESFGQKMLDMGDGSEVGLVNPEIFNTGHKLEDGDILSYFVESSIEYAETALMSVNKHSEDAEVYYSALLGLKALKSSGLTPQALNPILIDAGYGQSKKKLDSELQTIIESSPETFKSASDRLLIENKTLTSRDIMDKLSTLIASLITNLHYPIDPAKKVMMETADYLVSIGETKSIGPSLKSTMMLAGVNLSLDTIDAIDSIGMKTNTTVPSTAITDLYLDSLAVAPIVGFANTLVNINMKRKKDDKINVFPLSDYHYSSFVNCGLIESEYNKSLMKVMKSPETNVYLTAFKLRRSAEYNAVSNRSVNPASTSAIELLEAMGVKVNKKYIDEIEGLTTMIDKSTQDNKVSKDKLDRKYTIDKDNLPLGQGVDNLKHAYEKDIAEADRKLRKQLSKLLVKKSTLSHLFDEIESASHIMEQLKNQSSIYSRAH